MDTGAHSHVHNMAQMATSNANENTDEELKVKLNGRQWNAYLQQQAAASATMSAIDVLCNIYMTAMNDNSTKDARASSTMLRAFFTTKMSRVKQKDGNVKDQEFSVPHILHLMDEFKGDMAKINMWISTTDYPTKWINGVLLGLARSGACSPSVWNIT